MTLLTYQAPKLFGAKKQGDIVRMTFPVNKNVTYLGSGVFTSAYTDKQGKVYLFTFYNDHSKEILMWAKKQHPKNPHLPVMNYLGEFTHGYGSPVKVYQTRRYKPISKKTTNSDNWVTFRNLNKACAVASEHMMGKSILTSRGADKYNRLLIEYVNVPYKVKDALEAVADVATNYRGPYLFDNFRKANVRLDGRDSLILIDPVFDVKKLNDAMRKKYENKT